MYEEHLLILQIHHYIKEARKYQDHFPTVTIYDALDRPVQVNTPKGFFGKVTFTPWDEQHFDEDDTVLDALLPICLKIR